MMGGRGALIDDVSGGVGEEGQEFLAQGIGEGDFGEGFGHAGERGAALVGADFEAEVRFGATEPPAALGVSGGPPFRRCSGDA